MKRIIHICLIMAVIFSLGISSQAHEYRHNMSYIYFGNTSDYTYYVDRTGNSLNEISPSYFDLNDDGSLKLTAAVSDEFIRDMHDRSIAVVPFLSNHWKRSVGVNALNNRHALSDQIVSAIKEHNLDGVNIDIENVTKSEREAYVDFIRLLREKLPGDKILAVAVAANPYHTNSGWQGSYDYAGLAEYCDYLMIMAYDESYETGPAGPVASLPFVEKSVRYALGLVPGEKIVLGLPFYGRIWSNSGGYPQGYGISCEKVEQFISSYGGKVVFDETSQSPKATITIKPSDKKPIVGGKTLAAGTYTIWFENERSLKAKLALADKYDLRGTGSWSLGQETTDTWDYYKYWLNGCTFEDIRHSWAKEHILQAYVNGWITGFSENSFKPDSSLTRAQAAAILVRVMNLDVGEYGEYAFDDTKGSWAEEYINTARKHGLVAGREGNLFMPDSPVSRQEIAEMLNNILGYKVQGGVPAFSDVSENGNLWSCEAIYALAQKGVITGYPDMTFRPESHITRAEMAALLTRCFGM